MSQEMKKMMFEVLTECRPRLSKFCDQAFAQVHLESTDFNQLMITIMNLAFWLRADLELLLRLSYWQDLEESDFIARLIHDNKDLFATTLSRMKVGTEKTAALIGEYEKKGDIRKLRPLKPESNAEIIARLTYRKKENEGLYNRFYKILSKFAHPDPYFIAFPEQYRGQIENNVMNIFTGCKKKLDFEWTLLEKYLRSSL